MTRDHQIRIACGGLKGEERERTKLKLLTHPELITSSLRNRLRYPHRNGARTSISDRTRKEVNVSLRLTYPEYKELKRRASDSNWTLSGLIKFCCNL